MEKFFENNDSVSALEAQYNAQKIAFGPIVFQVARCMRDFGILQTLFEHQHGQSLEQLHKTTNISRYGLKVLLESSLSSDIVKQENELYFITKTGYFLLKDTMTIANMDYNHYVNYKAMFSLDEAITSQTPTGLKEFGAWDTIYPALSSLPPKVRDSWFTFDHLYSDSAYPEALQILLHVNPKKVLDIGGNTGKFTTLLVQSNHALHVSILDIPEQLELVKKRLESLHLGERVGLIAGNVLKPDFHFPKGFDVLWMSQFLDCFCEEEIIRILACAKESMKENTTLFIMEPFWDRQRFETSAFCVINTSPYFTVMANGNSKMYHSDDFLKLVKKAGLTPTKIYDHVGICQTIIALQI